MRYQFILFLVFILLFVNMVVIFYLHDFVDHFENKKMQFMVSHLITETELQKLPQILEQNHQLYINRPTMEMNTSTKTMVKMGEYLRFYINENNIQWENTFYSRDVVLQIAACPKQIRPMVNNIHTWKGVYQRLNLQVKNEEGLFPAFLLNFYFDDRFVETGSRFVRTVMSIKGPGPEWERQLKERVHDFLGNVEQTTLFALFWYKGFENPVSSPCYAQDSGDLYFGVDYSYYYQYLVTCKFPEIDLYPVNVSLVSEECGFPTTYKPILYPPVKANPATRAIGLCVQPMFGTLDRMDIPYLVSWLEMLRIFGIAEVNMANVSLSPKDNIINKAFQHYKDTGFLIIRDYPIINPTWPTKEDEKGGSYSVKQIAISDCFYRNLKKYWYVLIHDMDELIVPYRHKTYVKYLTYYTQKHKNETYTGCFAVRSSYFYRFFPPSSKTYPDYVPLLKYSRRFPPEPLGLKSQGYVGMSKSFSNMRTLVTADSHTCWIQHNPKKMSTVSYLPIDDILVHHYRKECDNMNIGHINCTHLNETVKDYSLDKYASVLIPRVEGVLHKIGYLS